MFGQIRWSPFEDIFNFQRSADRFFDQLGSEWPVRSMRNVTPQYPVNVQTSEGEWRLEIPMPGIDPKDVSIEVAGNTLVVRAEQHGGQRDGETSYEQTMTVPRFLDLDAIRATHRHGMLELTLPLKENLKPRRIAIESVTEPQKQLTTT